MIGSSNVLILEHLTARKGESVCQDISLSVPAGTIHLLLGKAGSGKAAIVACVLGECRPSSGRIWIAGEDATSKRRSIFSWVEAVKPETRISGSVTVRRLSKRRARSRESWREPELQERLLRIGVPLDQPWRELSAAQRTAALFALALTGSPRLIVFHGADFGPAGPAGSAWVREVVEATSGGISVFIATHRPGEWEDVADGVSILRSRRLLFSGSSQMLKKSFRRIRYRNEVTLERKEYGNELDDFDAAQVQVRGWGVEAVVSNFSDSLYEQFRRTPGVVDVQAIPMSLAEIFETLAKPQRVAPPP